jgi:hypothetical protein
MPELIEHIDAIARQQQRAVLYLEFHSATAADPTGLRREYDYASDPQRRAVLVWLDEQGLAWGQCGEFADINTIAPYKGQIYLEVPYDDSLADYRRLRDYLENPDGSMRLLNVRFCVMPLDYAMRNAEHDVPGFWERRAEEF